MKWYFVLLSLLLTTVLFAQSENTALQLHEEAKTILQESPLTAFHKIEALDKFQQSQQLLNNGAIENREIQLQNDSQILVLQSFFALYQNADSILQQTRFFPDSIFQEDTRYTAPFKDLVTDYLTVKRRALRKVFLNFKQLNYTHPSIIGTPNQPTFKITFENYWPLEIMAFEQWLEQEQNSLKNHPKSVQEQLFYSSLQQKMTDLEHQETKADYELSTRRLLENLTQSEQEKESLATKNKYLKYIGLGTLTLILLIGYLFWNRGNQLLNSKHQALLEEKKRSEDLLANILPSEVLRQLKNEKTAKAQRYESVCILFSDFQNFSQISQNLPPEELVRELDYCFTAFDHIIDKYHLDKIKTIGDAYMCVGGLYTKGNKHIQRMVAAALEIQEFLTLRKMQRDKLGGYFFEARIGIHTGAVVAGVIGTKKIAFDIWGDTVNIAQQMEQHGQVGKVNISDATHKLVEDYFNFTYRGEITVKNGNSYEMYAVEEKEDIADF